MTRIRFISADGADVSEVDAAAGEEEEDMLDLAFHVTRHSRLACQIWTSDALDSLTVRMPGGSHDMQGR